MRRVRLSWCARRTGAENPEDADIHRVDEQLDRLGAREPASLDDPALRLLGSLAEDVDEDAPPRRAAPKRRLLSKAALTTGLTIVALSGTGAATATVMVGGVSSLQPIHHAVEALYERDEQPEDLRGPVGAVASETADSPDVSAGEVRNALARAREAMDAGHLGEGQRWLREARVRWSELGAPSGALEHALSAVEGRLQTMEKDARGPEEVPSMGASVEPSTGAGKPTSGATPTAAPGGGDGSDGATPSPTPGDSSPPSASPSPSPSSPPNGGRSDDTGETDDSSNDGGDTGGGRADDTGEAGGPTGGGRADDTGEAGGQPGGGHSDDARDTDSVPGHGHPDGGGDTATGRPGDPSEDDRGRSSGTPGAAHGRSEDPPGHRHGQESTRASWSPHGDRPHGDDSRAAGNESERRSEGPPSSVGGPPESRDSQDSPWKDG